MIMSSKYLVADDGIWSALDSLHKPFPGIYRLHVLDEQGFLPLSRLLDVDPDGVIYIGTSVSVPGRVASLKKSISAAYKKVDPQTYAHLPYIDEGTHQTGKKIVRIPRFVERFRFDRLCVTVERYTGDDEALDVVENGHTALE